MSILAYCSGLLRISGVPLSVTVMLLPLIVVVRGGGALADNPHDAIRSSLVYIVTTAESETGIPLRTEGTGTVVSSDGYILTSYHLLSELSKGLPAGGSTSPGGANFSKIRADTVRFHVSIGKKSSDPTDIAAVINGIPETDLLLLKIAEGPAPFPFAQLALNSDLILLSIGTTVYTSGFPASLNDIAYSDQISSKNGPGVTWTLGKPPMSGQSGSPVYNEKGKVIGLLKGDVSAGAAAMVPIQLASGLLDPIKFRLIEDRIEELNSAVSVSQCYLVQSVQVNQVLLQLTVSQDSIERGLTTLDMFKSRDVNSLSVLERQLRDDTIKAVNAARGKYAEAKSKAEELSNGAPSGACSSIR